MVAAVYAAAGWSVSREAGRVVVEREEPVPERRELVVAADSTAPSTDAGPVAENPGVGTNGRRTVDADALYDRLRYGLGREAAADVLATHLPAAESDPRPPGRGPPGRHTVGAGPHQPTSGHSSGRFHAAATWGVLAAVILVVAAVLVAGVGPTDGTDPPLSVADRTETLRRVVTCPAPPRAVAPAVLRPRVGPPPLTADAWHQRDATRLGAFDLLDRSSIATPDRLALATYVGPGNRRYRVTVARWANRSLAAGPGMRMGVPHVVYAWGAYTLGVQSESADGHHRRGPESIASSRRVLEGVPAGAVSALGTCGAGRL